MKNCTLCPRRCGVDRTRGGLGWCRSTDALKVASVALHRDEEPPISGTRGSGAVFFSGCNLRCMFCQNFPISRGSVGRSMAGEELAGRLLDLQGRGAHNINLVTGTHFVPVILEALRDAKAGGLGIPVVWNTGGYERVETLELLEGFVDIYLADYKFSSAEAAGELASAPDYPETAERALVEMARQAGPLEVDGEGIARKGLIVRHLVLPGGLSGTRRVIEFTAGRLPSGVALSLMSQYTPYADALSHEIMGRRLTRGEYETALCMLEDSGIGEGWTQDME